jgi:hypothetical protein
VDENINYKQIALLNRAYMANVWQKVNNNDDLTEEEELLAEQMQAHPEYEEIWSDQSLADHLFDPTREENPFLHVSLHVMLERQIVSGEPPCVGRTVERLETLGENPHEVRHALLRVLVQETWEVMTRRRPFDVKRYCEKVEDLAMNEEE